MTDEEIQQKIDKGWASYKKMNNLLEEDPVIPPEAKLNQLRDILKVFNNLEDLKFVFCSWSAEFIFKIRDFKFSVETFYENEEDMTEPPVMSAMYLDKDIMWYGGNATVERLQQLIDCVNQYYSGERGTEAISG